MIVYHADIVQHAWDVQPPEKTVEGALAFLLRVIDVLPANEQAGLLLKPTGENISPWRNGQMVSAGRICYPDGRIYKILTDIPTTNGPSWQDDGTVDPARYLPVGRVPQQPEDPPPPVEPVDHVALMAKLEAITVLVQALRDRPWPEYTAPIPAIPMLGNAAGTLVLKPR